MKKFVAAAACMLAACVFVLSPGMSVCAKESAETIHSGIYIGDIDVSGMTERQAASAIKKYVDELSAVPITLNAVNGKKVKITAGDLGIKCNSAEVVAKAAGFGQDGNVVERYKALKDLERDKKVFDMGITFDNKTVTKILSDKCAKYDIEAKDASLSRENGAFVVKGGQTGQKIDQKASAKTLDNFLKNWNHKEGSIDLVVVKDEPKGNKEELSKVKDVLGSFTTSYTTSNADRSANVANGTRLANGKTVYPGDTFSMYEAVSPFSEENGYHLAGSYLNGTVVESLGGGICQVSTTLYNAVLLSELEVVERHNHSMIVTYVDPSSDAAIAESSGKDFKFKNNTKYPVYIEGSTSNKHITFTVYGVETRPADRKVVYQSETLSEVEPTATQVVASAALPVGTVQSQGAHKGITAKLWKIVTENGKETKTQVNSSTYKMVPKILTVGTATADPTAAAAIQAAIASGDETNIKNTAAALKTGDPAVSAQVAQQQALLAQQAALLAQQQALNGTTDPNATTTTPGVTDPNAAGGTVTQ